MKKVIYILGGVVFLILVYSILPKGQTSEEYAAFIQKERQEKIDFLKTNSASPFRESGIEMGELKFFPVDENFKVNARVERIEKRQFVNISSSDGKNIRYLKFAWLHFDLNDQTQKLLVLKPQFGVGLFLAFADATSGDTSYGGGRYLDLPEFKGDRISLDFNLAYNPYCAYVPNYSCPFPPRENILSVEIKSGEKNY